MVCVKRKDNRGFALFGSSIDGVDDCSVVQSRDKGMSCKTSFPCPQPVKRYNKGMGGVDLMNQLTSTYQLDRRSKTRYYLCLFFDLWDIALVNAYIFMVSKHQLDYQVIVAKILIGNYNNWRRNPQTTKVTAASRK